jgi:putative AdoMet-dependent methyltransferase
MADLFPTADFDNWAETYDQSVLIHQFPFYGYPDVLAKVVVWAEPRHGLSVLDLGTGTGNLAIRFATLGCEIWCTDFSEPMLAKARGKIPAARFFLHDLRQPLPTELERTFDRIISAYVFHHFELDEKLRILQSLVAHHLSSTGRIVIGDIAFQDQAALEKVKIAAGDEWEDEYYWIADRAIPTLEKVGFKVEYTQVSSCAGVFALQG